MRETHGEAYEEFEALHQELERLSNEMDAMTHHGIALDATFSKFGYSARLRTIETHEESPEDDVPQTVEELEQKIRQSASALVFWKKPIIRQYFHKGLIWRASHKTEPAPFELFVDLLYVGVIGINGDRAAEQANGVGLLYFTITFIISYKLWAELTLMISWFETDDVVERLVVCFFTIVSAGPSRSTN